MPDFDSSLTAVIEAILREQHCGQDADVLSAEESQRVRRLIRDCLEITDSPSDLDPFQIADFIYWNCEDLSRNAAERWLRSMTDKEIGHLLLGDVLMALAPGCEGGIEELADENEEERMDEQEG